VKAVKAAKPAAARKRKGKQQEEDTEQQQQQQQDGEHTKPDSRQDAAKRSNAQNQPEAGG
jgi:hypothetical protein